MKLSFQARVGTCEVDLSVESPSLHWVLTGPNGAGKTTLLELMLGLIPAQAAFLQLGERVLVDTRGQVSTPTEKRRLAYVPQDGALFPHLTVRENIAFAVESAGGGNEDIDSALASLQLQPLQHQLPAQLSGGEKQKVALARALSTRPLALLLDEPLASLDVVSRKSVRHFLAETLSGLQLPTVVVTHDPADARALGDFFVVLEKGRVSQCGTWTELATNPACSFVREFVSPA